MQEKINIHLLSGIGLTLMVLIMMKIQKVPQQKGTLAAFMNLVEQVCNKLPPPAILFCLLFVLTALLGALFTEMGVHLENPATHHIVTAQNFFSKAGIQWLLTNM